MAAEMPRSGSSWPRRRPRSWRQPPHRPLRAGGHPPRSAPAEPRPTPGSPSTRSARCSRPARAAWARRRRRSARPAARSSWPTSRRGQPRRARRRPTPGPSARARRGDDVAATGAHRARLSAAGRSQRLVRADVARPPSGRGGRPRTRKRHPGADLDGAGAVGDARCSGRTASAAVVAVDACRSRVGRRTRTTGRPTHRPRVAVTWTILEIGSSMMSVAPASFERGDQRVDLATWARPSRPRSRRRRRARRHRRRLHRRAGARSPRRGRSAATLSFTSTLPRASSAPSSSVWSWSMAWRLLGVGVGRRVGDQLGVGLRGSCR